MMNFMFNHCMEPFPYNDYFASGQSTFSVQIFIAEITENNKRFTVDVAEIIYDFIVAIS